MESWLSFVAGDRGQASACDKYLRQDDAFMRLRRHSARVKDPIAMRMGSPQYGQLILDGEPIASADAIEFDSLVWSTDRRLLAAQELVSWFDGPKTRVVVIDADQRRVAAASPPAGGLCTPVRLDGDALVYRHWHHRRGERELRLPGRE
jgi:hypothetical protein